MLARARALWSSLKPRLGPHALGLAVAGTVLALGLIAYLSTSAAWRAGSDGFYSYVYARSLAFDGDLDFTNDYRLCGDPFHIGQERVPGRPDNIFYFGPALFWTPILLLLRAVGVSGDGCGLPWSFVCLLIAPFLAAVASFATYRFVARWFSAGVSAAAVGVTFFGGPVLLCAAGLPSYAHVYELFLSSLVCLAGSGLGKDPGKKRIAVVALALAALITQRVSNVTFILLPLAALAGSAQPRQQRLLAALGVTLGALAGCAVQGVINAELYGSPLALSHGPHFLSLANAHPFLTLFDAEEGLLFFWPTVWLSLLGIALIRRTELRLTVIGLAGIVIIELILDSSALDWAPARRFLKLAPVFSLFAAYPLERMSDWLSRRPERWRILAAAATIAPLAAWSTGLTWGAPRGAVELGTPLRQKQLYGGGVTGFWQLLDSAFGTLPIL
ncbi:MAG TPA: hypothetical protein VM686_02850, partial [Polyangiaceae bacterium]|nr:hypothetical protein [Polyangiaceae bacterium]